MSIQERKNLEEKLETASKYIESIDKNKGKLYELESAVKYLSDKRKPISKPHKRDENVIYREQVTDKIAAYDKAHQPQKPTLGCLFYGCIATVFITVVCFIVMMIPYGDSIWATLAHDWQEITFGEQMLFIAICVIFVLLPLCYMGSVIPIKMPVAEKGKTASFLF